MTALEDADWSPGPKYRELLMRANDLLGEERRTIRDVYYALESHGYDYDYRQVERALKKGRRAGFIAPSAIIDTSRPTTVSPTSDKDRTLRERFIESVTNGRDANIELNALKEFHREFLESLVEDGIREHVDLRAKARVERQVRVERMAIDRAVSVDEAALDEDDP